MRKEHDGKFMAGGHSLIPVMKLRLADPGCIVDIGRIDGLKGLTREGSDIKIGALTTHATVAGATKADDLPEALTEAAGWIGDPMVRNRGTVGGNVAHADPSSDLPTVLTALGASMEIAGESGSRSVGAADFFTGLFETAMGEDELLVSVTVPSHKPKTGTAYSKLFNPASRYAIVGAAASIEVNGGNCKSASVAIGGLTPNAKRCASVEALLNGKEMTEANIQAAAEAVANDLGDDILGDIHASIEYRKSMAVVFVKRAITKAVERTK